MERTSLYITVAEAVRVFRISEEDVRRFCAEKKIGYAQEPQGDELFPSADDLAFALKRAMPEDVSFVTLDATHVITLREKKDKVVTYTNGALHHDDGHLLPPLEKKLLLQQEMPPLLDDPVAESLLHDGKEDVLLSSPVVNQEVLSVAPDPSLLTAQSAPLPEIIPHSQEHNTEITEEETTQEAVVQAEKTPVFNVKPVFIPKDNGLSIQAAGKRTPQNPRPIVAEKKIPVPHAPIFAPIGSIHPLAQPPSVIPFATPAPAAHVKVAAVYTQPHARVVEWMPWMRTSQWLRRAVSKATRNPDVFHAHPGLPVAPMPTVAPNPSVVPLIQNVKNSSSPAPLSVQSAPPVPDEKQAPVVRMQHPEVQDALDRALFGQFVPPKSTEQVSSSESVQKADPPSPQYTDVMSQGSTNVGGSPKIQDSWDALLFS
jgi:hypothetical protein